LIERTWDAIVIGTGMGGATLGYALARAGKSVLFCERGVSSLAGRGVRGEYAEVHIARKAGGSADLMDELSRAGRCNAQLVDLSGAKPYCFVPFIGAGTGGSSALYGMALERLFPSDFEPRQFHRSASESTLPQSWPIAYEALAHYYIMAERLYRARGSHDPLRGDSMFGYVADSPGYSPAAQELVSFLQRKGLHPYHLPLACNYVPRCSGCQGYLCARQCKNDSAQVCLAPALTNYDASLLDNCEVVRLESSAHSITGVIARWRERDYRLKGKIIALAAGALATPALLLRSATSEWPNGLANESGLVGRNLMRHYVDLYAVFTKETPDVAGNLKEIGLNDLYVAQPRKLGSIQSFGAMPPAQLLVDAMQEDLRGRCLPTAAASFGLVKPLLRRALDMLFSRAMILATIMEDLPYRENRVIGYDTGKTGVRNAIKYAISTYDRQRISDFRKRMRHVLNPYRYLLLKQAENNQRLAHVCGTCRFGFDPKDSVLDRNNKTHGIDNLYVVDASFFPSSGGTNPALTVAANALRVAEHLSG
jgi:choline dehydrogenase-like flavoprotein